MQTTRKYPRTLDEAFGPYASKLAPLTERYDPMPKADKIVTVGSCVLAIVVLALAVFGVI